MSVAESNVSSHPDEPRSGEPRSAPARSRAATRARLLEAGTELFAAEGLHGVTSAAIARAAGVATGTFYLHFRDKKALFREIVFDAVARLRGRMEEASRDQGGDLHAELRARTTEMVAFAEQNGSLIRVLFGREHQAAELGEAVLDLFLPGIEEGLRARHAAGALPDGLHAETTAQALLGQTSRVLGWWVEHPDRASRQDVVLTLLHMHPAFQKR